MVKCPLIIEGLKATRALSNRGIKVNVTLVFQSAPGARGGQVRRDLIFRRSSDGLTTSATTASRWSINWLSYSAQLRLSDTGAGGLDSHPHSSAARGRDGAHVATLPFAVMKQILHHPLTDMGLEKFLADWRATKQKI